jgi:type I restriction enzyme, S subunit
VSLNLDKSSWKRVRLGDVIRRSRTQLDPVSSGVERYVAGGHVDSEGVTIERWGQVGDGQMGSTFRYVFKPGHVLFVSARPYLRKIGVPGFSGVVADKTYVLDAISENGLLQEFLPFLLSSEAFIEYANAEATGSMNPRLLWGPMQRYEFDLPPLDEQKRLADLLWAVEQHRRSLAKVMSSQADTRSAWLHSLFAEAQAGSELVELDTLIERDRPICYGVLKPGQEFDSGRLIVDVKDYPSGSIKVDEVRRSDPAIESQFKRSRLRTGDVLLSIRGTIGRVAIVPPELDGHNISRDSARLSGDQMKVMPEFLCMVLESPDVQDEIRRTTTGLAVKGINVARIRALRAPRWDLDRQKSAVHRMQVIEEAVTAVEEALSTLVGVQRSLLDEVFGGAV